MVGQLRSEHPSEDFHLPVNYKEAFEDWFNGPYGSYSLRSEWFYGDCDIEDKNVRKEQLCAWLQAAFVSGASCESGTPPSPWEDVWG